MSLLPTSARNNLRDPVLEEVRGRYFGRYQGFVADRADPEKRGRIRARIPSLLQADGVSGQSGWAECATGSIVVPPMGAPVWIEFEMGYADSPVFGWGWVSARAAAPKAAVELEDPNWLRAASGTSLGYGSPRISIDAPADPARAVKPQYPYNKAFTTESGVTVEVDDSPGRQRLRVYHPAGTTVLIDADGSLQIATAGAMHFRPGGDVNFLLNKGSTFKVVYPNSSGFAVGATGLVLTGPQCTILGRAVIPSADDIR